MRGVLASRGSQFDVLATQVDTLTEELKEAKHVSGVYVWVPTFKRVPILDLSI